MNHRFHLLMPAKNAKGGWHQFHQQKTQMVGGTNFTMNHRFHLLMPAKNAKGGWH
jgi:hypothetical protein